MCKEIRIFTFNIFLFINVFQTRAQLQVALTNSGYPEVGQPCPDFLLKNIKDYPRQQVSNKDLKGQFYILNFWTKYCTVCVRHFPNENELQKQFKGKVQMFLIGLEDNEHQIENIYERSRGKMQLCFPYCFEDSSSFRHFVPGPTPYLIYVDDKGIIQAITYDATPQMVEAFLDRKKFDFHDISEKAYFDKEKKKTYDSDKPILTNNNGGYDTSFLFRSLLVPYNPEIGSAVFEIFDNFRSIKAFYGERKNWPDLIRYEIHGCPLNMLYMLAYIDKYRLSMKDSLYKKYYPYLVLEMNDSSLFNSNEDDFKNRFTYSISLPKSRAYTSTIQRTMQRDLQTFFGYNVIIEKRLMPCWKLVASNKAKLKLKTKGGTFVYPDKLFLTGLSLKNTSMNYLMNLLYECTWREIKDNIVDETGISGNIDIVLDPVITGDLSNFDDLLTALRNSGLDLIKGQQMINAIIIKENSPDENLID